MANENDEAKGPKTKPLRMTSAVPLRKETVRVTLKATPGGAPGAPGGAAPPAPAPPKPPSVATTPLETAAIEETAPVKAKADEPNLPDTTSAVPLRQETMRVTLKATGGAPMAPAPSGKKAAPAPSPPKPPSVATTPLQPKEEQDTPAAATPAPVTPTPATPAPTIPLGGAPAGGGATPAATIPLATQPLGGGDSSQPLPKATVQLQQTQQLGAAPAIGGGNAMPTIQTVGDDEPETSDNKGTILAIAAFVVALAALAVTLLHAKHWIDEHKEGSWEALIELDEPNTKRKKEATKYIYKGN